MISIELLLQQSLFEGLAQQKLQALSKQIRLQEFAKGEFVFHRGMQGDALVLLIRGRLQVISYSESGKEVGINFIEPGEYLGEVALIDGQPRSASVVCVSPSTLGFLAKPAALDLFHHEPLVAARIQKRLCAVIRNEINRRSRFSSASAFERVCSVLCSHPRLNLASESVTLDDLPHQRVIASMANVTRETVNRTLKTLIENGVLEKRGRVVTVHRPLELRQLADGRAGASSATPYGTTPLSHLTQPHTRQTNPLESGLDKKTPVVKRYDRPKTID
jgi:CRP/FNR family transcriptional regulator, cyclic AMP receptor protein